MKLFEKARYYVQARELEFALNPPSRPTTAPTKRRSRIEAPFAGCTFITVDGEYVYNDAITFFPTPGHSVGHQSVAVRTAKGTVVIAGDAVFVEENMQGDPGALLEFIPSGGTPTIRDVEQLQGDQAARRSGAPGARCPGVRQTILPLTVGYEEDGTHHRHPRHQGAGGALSQEGPRTPGIAVLIMDAGIYPSDHGKGDIGRHDVALAGGRSVEELIAAEDRARRSGP